jgi:hypothetical protein
MTVWRVARVPKSLLGRHQSQELGGVGGLDVLGSYAVLQRLERDFGEKGPTPAIHFVSRSRIGVKVVVGVESLRRHFGDGVQTAADYGPVTG